MPRFLHIPALGAGVTVEMVAAVGSPDGGATHHYDDIALGDPATDRDIIVVYAASRGAYANSNLTAASIGGVAATIGTWTTSAGTVNGQLFVFWARVPSGVTGDIDLTFTGTPSGKGFAVYRVTGMSAPIAAHDDFATAAATGAATTQAVTGLDVPAGGFAVGAAYTGTGSLTLAGISSPNLSWAVDANVDYSGSSYYTGFVHCDPDDAGASAETVTASFSASPGPRCVALWSFSP